MKLKSLPALLALLCSAVPGRAAEDPTPAAPSPRETFQLYLNVVPRVATVLRTNTTNGVRITRLRFESVEGSKDGATNRNEIYAILARPENTTGPLPGVLICHGGGQQAQEEKAACWARLGFVAIAPEFPGYMSTERVRSLSRVKGTPMASQMFSVSPNACASTLFDSVMSGLLAFNLLASQPDVDRKQICITGISWGGYMTTYLSGLLGDRVRAGFSLYGSGFYLADSAFTKDLKSLKPERRQEWIRNYDAGTRLTNARATLFLCPAAKDHFFRPPSVLATYDAITSPKFLCFGPRQSHWIDLPGGTTTWDGPTYTEMEPVFFRSVFEGKTLPKLALAKEPGTFSVQHLPKDAKVWAYYSTNLQTNWPARVWIKADATALSPTTFQAVVPEGLKAYDWYGGISFDATAGGLTRPMSLTTAIKREGQPATSRE